MNVGSEPDSVTAAGKRRLPWEEKITVMELTHMHVSCKHMHVLQTYIRADVSAQMHTHRGACTQTLPRV